VSVTCNDAPDQQPFSKLKNLPLTKKTLTHRFTHKKRFLQSLSAHIEPPRGLNSRQVLFVSAYLLCNVAAEAARMPGYKDAKSAAAYLMNHPLVLEEIRFAREYARRGRCGLTG
jgi:hypothetical protein